jgi:hypothetical protein
LAGTGNGQLRYSYDGFTWTATTGSTLTAYYKIATNGSVWIALGASFGTLIICLQSYNGKDWKQRAGTAGTNSSVACNGSTLIIGYSIIQGIYRSIDNGITWFQCVGTDLSNFIARSVVWTGKYWVAAGSVTVSGQPCIVYSIDDGVSWSRVIGSTATNINDLASNIVLPNLAAYARRGFSQITDDTTLVISNTTTNTITNTPEFVVSYMKRTATVTNGSTNTVMEPRVCMRVTADTGYVLVNSRMGINNSAPAYPLDVGGNESLLLQSSSAMYYSFSGATYRLPEPVYITIYAANAIFSGSGFLAASDSRIKKNITDISDGDALNKLRLIEPVEYDYIDIVSKGTDRVYGFIAQQVKEQFSNAVTKTHDFIPNIYSLKQIEIYDGSMNQLTYTQDMTPPVLMLVKDISESAMVDISENVSKMRIIDYNGQKIECIVISKLTQNSVLLDTSDMNQMFAVNPSDPTRLFIYGTNIEDFLALKKEYLFTINFAATQELDRIIQRQQTTIDTLTAQNAALQTQIDAIKTHIGMT